MFKEFVMKCGCAPNATTEIDNETVPCCAIHDCYEQAEVKPDLTDRTARCSYFGKKKPNRRYANDECSPKRCLGKPTCECGSIPSSFDLAFFSYKPDKEQDSFYCGCFGWD